MSGMHQPLTVADLGRMAYAEALRRQQLTNERIIGGAEPDTILLVEHDPVITLTPRASAADHLLASRDELRRLGIDVHQTDRGGDVTYHGPGQLVVYPIVRLGRYGLNLGGYMRLLERVVIDTLCKFGIEGYREPGATGVWVSVPSRKSQVASPESENSATETQNPKPETHDRAKICAMGVRVRKNVTMHGLALNVDPDLSHFATIVPCGLAGRSVTSLTRLLGDRAPTMDTVKAQLVRSMRSALDGAAAAAITCET